MGRAPLTISETYWNNLEVNDQDLEFLYNHLLEIETPQTPQELLQALVAERIRVEKQALEHQRLADGAVYMPKNRYQPDEELVFPALDYRKGKVTAVRAGQNPDMPPFEVITVTLEDGEENCFAAALEDHILNQPLTLNQEDPNLDIRQVLKRYGKLLLSKLNTALEDNVDLVCIAGRWFPHSLLVDVNIGHLNLAEALLDMEGGGPLTTAAIMEQIDMPANVNSNLNEFSLNLALQEDGRFDEVGPAGQTLWFLRRLEPEAVQSAPVYLRYHPVEYDPDIIAHMTRQLESQVCDEIEPCGQADKNPNEITVSLIFPHWRAGTLPLSDSVAQFFPTAYESPRVQFTFVDGDSGQKFSGWVVRPLRYVYGLQDWYRSQGLIPGSLIQVTHGKNPGEVIIRAQKRRANREWIRTALIGADGGIVFAMLKQLVSTHYDERMAIAIPDLTAVNQLWEAGGRQRQTLEQTVMAMIRELAKLNPQGSVHAQELYAAVNLVRRCPPGPILSILANRPWAIHVGDLYFRLEDTIQENSYGDR